MQLSSKDLKEINKTRKFFNLPPIEIKKRKCLRCGKHFTSLANRTCGCSLPEPVYPINEYAPER